jgi:hypothetical protein
VQTIVNSQRITEGTPLIFQMRSQPERDAIEAWLAEDSSRKVATWINQRGKPLLWAFDRQQYSPTGVVMRIWELAGWEDHPVAVQGPDRWTVPGQGTLSEISRTIQDEEEATGDDL